MEKNGLLTDTENDLEETISYTPNTLEEDLRKMDRTFNDANDIRQAIIQKLTPIVLDMELNTEVVDREGASALDAQMGVITTLNNILNDTEKSVKTKIDIKTRQRELVENGRQAEAFITALNDLSKAKAEEMARKAQASADEELDIRITDEHITVNEAELRSDPTDLT